MEKSLTLKALLLVVSIFLVGNLQGTAQDGRPKATLPFKQLYGLVNPDLKGAPKGFKYESSVVVTASGEPLPPKDLELHLEIDGRRVPVAVTKEGVVQLPNNQEWAKDGAFIVANQPKGSMSLSIDISFSGKGDFREKNETRYQDLMMIVHFGLRLMRTASDLTGQVFAEADMVITFQVDEFEGQKPVATVHAEAGKIEYPADAKGIILIPYKGQLYAENPKVDLPPGKLSFSYGKGKKREDQPAEKPMEDEDV